MLIERPQWFIGLIAAVLVLAGTGVAMVATGSTQLVRGERFEAEFTDASALKAGDFVFVSGVRAGSVTDVRQAPSSEDPDFADRGPVVVVEFALTSSARLPADVRAEIILSNTLGKRGLLLRPIDPSPEHLDRVGQLHSSDGVEITLGRTSTLTDLPEFGEDTTRLLEELDIVALRELSTALADVTQDQRQDVDRLLDSVLVLSDVLVRRRGELGTALDRAEAIVDVLGSRDQEIVQIIDNFQVTLTTLLRRQADIERLLVETAGTSTRTADLIGERRAQIDRVVADLTAALDVVDSRQVDLAHVFPYLDVGLQGFSSIGYVDLQKNDTGQWGNVFTTALATIGVEALTGCGSILDEALTALVGPDPNCDDSVPDGVGSDDLTSSSPPSSSSSTSGGVELLFRSGLLSLAGSGQGGAQ